MIFLGGKKKLCIQVYIVFVFRGVAQLPGCKSEEDFVKKLRTDLLTGYEKSILPVNENSTLNIQLLPESFRVDEKTSTFYLKLLLVTWWRDHRMRWNPKQYGKLLHLSFPSSELWTPALSVYNDAAAESVDRKHPVPIKVHWTGDMFWFPPAEFNTSCAHNVKKWPFDSNTCYIDIGSWIYLGLPMKNYPIVTNRLAYNPNSDWEVKLVNASIREQIFDCCPEYQSLTIRFDIKRRFVYPFALVCIPAIVIAITVLMSFWMEPKAPERTGLILIALLVNVYYLQFTADIVPPNGDDVPYIILYFRDSLVMIVIALLWTVCSRYIASASRTSNVPLPSFIIQFLESWPSKILCIAPRPNKIPQPGGLTEVDGSLIGLQSSVYNDWSWVAHLLDRLIFFLYTITYIIFLIAFL